MPKKKYNDDESLRRKALELRRLGMSYRGIAKELGCSVYKAYQLISQPRKTPITSSSIQRLAEDIKRLESMVADQLIKIRDIEAKIRELEAKQSELGNSILMLGADLLGELEKLKGSIK